jgi:hypothetical protein
MGGYVHPQQHYVDKVDETSLLMELLEPEIDNAVDRACGLKADDTGGDVPPEFAANVRRALLARLALELEASL